MSDRQRTATIRNIRTCAGALCGAALGFWYGVPLLGKLFDPASRELLWVFPLLAACAAGWSARRSAFACRMLGSCMLVTAPIIAFGLCLGGLLFATVPIPLRIAVPTVVALLGLLALFAGSNTLATDGRGNGRET